MGHQVLQNYNFQNALLRFAFLEQLEIRGLEIVYFKKLKLKAEPKKTVDLQNCLRLFRGFSSTYSIKAPWGLGREFHRIL